LLFFALMRESQTFLAYAYIQTPLTLTSNLPSSMAYLEDVLERMSNGHPMSRLDDLLPWNWRPITTLN
jgi:hypothetical protein